MTMTMTMGGTRRKYPSFPNSFAILPRPHAASPFHRTCYSLFSWILQKQRTSRPLVRFGALRRGSLNRYKVPEFRTQATQATQATQVTQATQASQATQALMTSSKTTPYTQCVPTLPLCPLCQDQSQIDALLGETGGGWCPVHPPSPWPSPLGNGTESCMLGIKKVDCQICRISY